MPFNNEDRTKHFISTYPKAPASPRWSPQAGPKGFITYTNKLIAFNQACSKTLDLVRTLNKDILDLQACYIWQRFFVLLESYQ
jgi:hypothetical protein